MRLPETRDLLSRELTFPADHDRVVEAVGDVELDPPQGEPETIAQVLDRSGAEEYASVDEVYDSLIGFVSDQYIGRKFYDDRGTNPDDPEVSF